MSKFILKEIHRNRKSVFYDSDDIHMCVGELSNDQRNGWRFHFGAAAPDLTISATAELRAFTDEQIILIKVTERLSK